MLAASLPQVIKYYNVHAILLYYTIPLQLFHHTKVNDSDIKGLEPADDCFFAVLPH